MLASDGHHACVPLSTVQGAKRNWLRNGLGQTVAAALLRQHDDAGLALLRLETPHSASCRLRAVPRLPFAASPASMVEYSSGDGVEPAWPWLRLGFFGRLTGTADERTLCIDAPGGPRGGPVFDAGVHLAGMALRDADGLAGVAEPPEGALETVLALPGPAHRAPADGGAHSARQWIDSQGHPHAGGQQR